MPWDQSSYTHSTRLHHDLLLLALRRLVVITTLFIIFILVIILIHLPFKPIPILEISKLLNLDIEPGIREIGSQILFDTSVNIHTNVFYFYRVWMGNKGREGKGRKDLHRP